MSDKSSHIEYDNTGDGIRSLIIRFDPHGKIIRFNSFALAFFGYTNESIIGKSLFDTILDGEERDRARFQSLISSIERDPENPVFAHIEARKENGNRVWISFSVTPVLNDRSINELICVGNDVSESKKMENELREMNESFKMMLENVPTGVFIIDPNEKTVLYSNFEAANMIGSGRESIIGERCDTWCSEMHNACLCIQNGSEKIIQHTESRINRIDGKSIHIFLSTAEILFRGSMYVLASFIDITKQKKTEESLLHASRQIEDILSSIVSVLIGVSIDDNITNWNSTAEDLFGISAGEIIGKRFPLCPIHWDWRRIYEGIANSVVSNRIIKLQSLHFKNGRGKDGYLDVTIKPVIDKSKKVTGYIIFAEDTTERQTNMFLLEEIERRKNAEDELRNANEELERLATRDSLTDLFNRRFFMQSLSTEFKRSLRYKTDLSLLMMDIDHFKNINDTFGHLVGDRVISSIAKTILEETRSTDISGRYGGEEFCIMLPMTKISNAMIIAEKLRKAISHIEFSDLPELRIRCSIGISELTANDPDNLAIIRRADEALYEAKNSGRDRCIAHIQNP